ncbi:MAG: hypothetical protein JW876_10780 [Candidatus Krumholzibacteriota bacterium]|nr:hypothetical protein [Candidatus Krumholzibacteriota bacterium]
MSHPAQFLYGLVAPLAPAALRLVAPFDEKIAETLATRRGIRPRWREKGAAAAGAGPLVWFHVSSVGEFLQATPVIDELAARRPDVRIALTFTSPSGYNYLHRHDRSRRNERIRFVEYLPFDTAGNARFCLDILRPDLLVYVKFDLWPNLILEASRRGVPQVLVSATLSTGSRRLAWYARGWYGSLYQRLSAIAAISDEDAGRFRLASGGGVLVETTGDTRFDQVCRRVDTTTVEPPRALLDDRRVFVVAGSTWPRDEAVVIPGFACLRKRHPETALILVPHEPTAARLAEIGRSLEAEGLRFALVSELGERPPPEPVVVADGLGYLAELYRAGTVAYVGGSFTTGVHNVMEPAVLGLPVFFGPRIDNSWEALRLAEAGAGRVVKRPGEFADGVSALLDDPALLARRGREAAGFIRKHCGAAPRCVDLLLTRLQA